MATYSITLAWRIPWTEEPGELQSMGSQSRTRLNDFHVTLYLVKMVEVASNQKVAGEGQSPPPPGCVPDGPSLTVGAPKANSTLSRSRVSAPAESASVPEPLSLASSLISALTPTSSEALSQLWFLLETARA